MESRSRVDLPPHVRPPLDVFVNGVPQVAGTDYELVGTTLLFPRVLEVSAQELDTLLMLEPHARRIGYDISLFGDRQVAIRGVPASLPEDIAIEALKRLLCGDDGHADVDASEPPEERIAKTYACHAAVRSGQALNPEERRALFDRLFATSLPHGDPHGRPTYVRVAMEELDRRFGRR